MRTASASALVRRPRAEVFAFHADAANLASVVPLFQLRGPLAALEPLAARAVSAFLATKLRRTAAVLDPGGRPSRHPVGPESSRALGGSSRSVGR